jgi:hypothetical protein
MSWDLNNLVLYYRTTNQYAIMPETIPLSGKGEILDYQQTDAGYNVQWGDTSFQITTAVIKVLQESFFQPPNTWKPLGASMTNAMAGGMGEFIKNLNIGLTPRHASAIAAILVNENQIEFQAGRPILLRWIN